MVCIPKPPRCPLHSHNTAGCAMCITYQSGMDKRRRKLKAYGLFDNSIVSADKAREHILKLRQLNWTNRKIAAAAGMSYPNLVQGIITGRCTQVRERTANKILAVPIPDTVDDGLPRNMVPTTGTSRRMKALAAIGYGWEAQARFLGISRNSAWRTGNEYYRCVSRSRAREVADMYDKLSMLPAPDGEASVKARNTAARHGWAPPLAWDDDTIDDPRAQPNLGAARGPALPDEAAVTLAVEGRRGDIGRPLNRAEKHEAVRRLRKLGWSSVRIGRHLGMSTDSVWKIVDRQRNEP